MTIFKQLLMSLPVAVAALCLGACVSLQHERCLEPYREYAGYKVSAAGEYESAGAGGLYRCGEEWYVAAVRCRAEVYEDHLPPVSLWEHRRSVILHPEGAGNPVLCYHKITPTMAARMQQERHTILPHELKAALREAGGAWVESRPHNAQRVRITCTGHYALAEQTGSHAPWYAYPAAGLTLLCVDVPLTALLAVPSGLIYSLMWSASQMDERSMKADIQKNPIHIKPLPPQNVHL